MLESGKTEPKGEFTSWVQIADPEHRLICNIRSINRKVDRAAMKMECDLGDSWSRVINATANNPRGLEESDLARLQDEMFADLAKHRKRCPGTQGEETPQ